MVHKDKYGHVGKILLKHVPHHDVEVDVLAALFSRKQGQVLRLQLGGVVQHRPRVEPSFRDGHVIFDACRVDGK